MARALREASPTILASDCSDISAKLVRANDLRPRKPLSWPAKWPPVGLGLDNGAVEIPPATIGSEPPSGAPGCLPASIRTLRSRNGSGDGPARGARDHPLSRVQE
jgi:hypothetical protein